MCAHHYHDMSHNRLNHHMIKDQRNDNERLKGEGSNANGKLYELRMKFEQNKNPTHHSDQLTL